MKNSVLSRLFIICVFFEAVFAFSISAKENTAIYPDSVLVVDQFLNLYRSGDYYFGGQPSLEMLRWLQSKGVNTIINLRSEKEMQKFTETSYDEENLTEELGIRYLHLPVEGYDAYNRNTLERFADLIQGSNGKIFIHCGSCYRVTYLMMAYLIEFKNYPVRDVVIFGKKLKYFSPVEELLGIETTICER